MCTRWWQWAVPGWSGSTWWSDMKLLKLQCHVCTRWWQWAVPGWMKRLHLIRPEALKMTMSCVYQVMTVSCHRLERLHLIIPEARKITVSCVYRCWPWAVPGWSGCTWLGVAGSDQKRWSIMHSITAGIPLSSTRTGTKVSHLRTNKIENLGMVSKPLIYHSTHFLFFFNSFSS
jgi:hypothetical protein